MIEFNKTSQALVFLYSLSAFNDFRKTMPIILNKYCKFYVGKIEQLISMIGIKA